ncbi:MAG: hypothetical protein H6741_23880 [Alphaproteobacteria bacterium]|nr:hypothetical protein [Alphaproteobacteria bacterium]
MTRTLIPLALLFSLGACGSKTPTETAAAAEAQEGTDCDTEQPEAKEADEELPASVKEDAGDEAAARPRTGPYNKEGCPEPESRTAPDSPRTPDATPEPKTPMPEPMPEPSTGPVIQPQ